MARFASRRSFLQAASTGMAFIRDSILGSDTDTWVDHRPRIQQMLFYPRGERIAPSMHRVDQALTTSVIGTACSDHGQVSAWSYTLQKLRCRK